jgi:hypothetical protein
MKLSQKAKIRTSFFRSPSSVGSTTHLRPPSRRFSKQKPSLKPKASKTATTRSVEPPDLLSITPRTSPSTPCLDDDANVARRLKSYINGFSENVREIFHRFRFDDAINRNPGEHFTPKDVIRLLVRLVLTLDTELTSNPSATRTVANPACGTGGIVTIAREEIRKFAPQSRIHICGQEINPRTWAVCKSDLLLLGPTEPDRDTIKLGSTLASDQFGKATFDLQFANPPYGYFAAWKEIENIKIFPSTDFGYRRIQIDRPLRLNFQVSEERLVSRKIQIVG